MPNTPADLDAQFEAAVATADAAYTTAILARETYAEAKAAVAVAQGHFDDADRAADRAADAWNEAPDRATQNAAEKVAEDALDVRRDAQRSLEHAEAQFSEAKYALDKAEIAQDRANDAVLDIDMARKGFGPSDPIAATPFQGYGPREQTDAEIEAAQRESVAPSLEVAPPTPEQSTEAVLESLAKIDVADIDAPEVAQTPTLTSVQSPEVAQSEAASTRETPEQAIEAARQPGAYFTPERMERLSTPDNKEALATVKEMRHVAGTATLIANRDTTGEDPALAAKVTANAQDIIKQASTIAKDTYVGTLIKESAPGREIPADLSAQIKKTSADVGKLLDKTNETVALSRETVRAGADPVHGVNDLVKGAVSASVTAMASVDALTKDREIGVVKTSENRLAGQALEAKDAMQTRAESAKATLDGGVGVEVSPKETLLTPERSQALAGDAATKATVGYLDQITEAAHALSTRDTTGESKGLADKITAFAEGVKAQASALAAELTQGIQVREAAGKGEAITPEISKAVQASAAQVEGLAKVAEQGSKVGEAVGGRHLTLKEQVAELAQMSAAVSALASQALADVAKGRAVDKTPAADRGEATKAVVAASHAKAATKEVAQGIRGRMDAASEKVRDAARAKEQTPEPEKAPSKGRGR